MGSWAERRKARKEARNGDESEEPAAAARVDYSHLSVRQKALSRGATWNKESFPEFPTVLHWVRVFLALLQGVAWAALGVQGWLGLTRQERHLRMPPRSLSCTFSSVQPFS